MLDTFDDNSLSAVLYAAVVSIERGVVGERVFFGNVTLTLAVDE